MGVKESKRKNSLPVTIMLSNVSGLSLNPLEAVHVYLYFWQNDCFSRQNCFVGETYYISDTYFIGI